MPAQVCSRACALVALTMALAAPAVAFAQSAPASFKVAWFNIQSGKGEPGMAGHLVRFSDTANCTDSTQPVNAWAIGMVQEHLTSSIGNDPKVVALGLAESWASVCASPENVRRVLGWKSKTSERNGVAMVARVRLRRPRGLASARHDAQSQSRRHHVGAAHSRLPRRGVLAEHEHVRRALVFVGHEQSGQLRSSGRADRGVPAERGGRGARTSSSAISTSGTARRKSVTKTRPTSACSACAPPGYIDAWPLLHGSAEGFTGMTNRAGCGFLGVGYAWKRPDYTWSPAGFLPLSIERFGIVPAGDEAPSDHYGLITEFPWPGAPPAPVDTVRVRRWRC